MNSTKVLKFGELYHFVSSGTSGERKRVSHERAHIEREIKYLAERVRARRILSVVRTEHIYGYLWTVLLPAALEVESVAMRGWTGAEVARVVREGDWIVGYGRAWERWVGMAWPGGVTGVHSGGAVDRGVVRALQEKGLARWVDVYGCTELGGIGWREGEAEEYDLFAYWPDNLGEEEAPDELHWRGDGRHFALGARRDGQVEVSGRLVSLDRVRAVLEEVEGVEGVLVKKMANEEGGRLRVLAVGRATEEAVWARCALALESWERPAVIRVMREWPEGANGKAGDW